MANLITWGLQDMGWFSSNSSEIAAFGSIFMDIATLVIIFFNMNQFRLNRRSLNIDINFKVFELRKNIYRITEDAIHELRKNKGFSQYVDLEQKTVNYNEKFCDFKEQIENSKYLFSRDLFKELENLLLLCEQGISLEFQVMSIKEQNPNEWTEETTVKIQEITHRKTDILNCILDFNTDLFLRYLNVSDFYMDFINSPQQESNKYFSFIKSILFKAYKLFGSYKKRQSFT